MPEAFFLNIMEALRYFSNWQFLFNLKKNPRKIKEKKRKEEWKKIKRKNRRKKGKKKRKKKVSHLSICTLFHLWHWIQHLFRHLKHIWWCHRWFWENRSLKIVYYISCPLIYRILFPLYSFSLLRRAFLHHKVGFFTKISKTI